MPSRSWSETLGLLLNCGRGSLSILWAFEARLKGCSLGRGVKFFGRPLISVAGGSHLTLGDEVRIHSALRSNPLGCFQPSVLRTLSPGAELVLEPRVGISATVLCAAASIRIGEGTFIGAGAMILDNDFHHPVENFGWGSAPAHLARPVRIGRGAFIGARAIVLKGVTIGDRAVVGAGAVVTRDVPDRHLAAGNPAQIRPLKNMPPAAT
jgi:acetyltransferase-like isoleucine patch superfamily enzyme